MLDDLQLLRNYGRRGDVSSLSALVVRHSTWMLAFLRSMLPSEADADDAFQDAWVRVMKTAAGYRGGKLKSFLMMVARSVAIDRLRRQGRMTSLDELEDSSFAETPDPGLSPGERFERLATSAEIREAVKTLPLGQRQVLLMRIEGEMTFREIAEEMGIPLGTALTWMKSATAQLRKRLGTSDGRD